MLAVVMLTLALSPWWRWAPLGAAAFLCAQCLGSGLRPLHAVCPEGGVPGPGHWGEGAVAAYGPLTPLQGPFSLPPSVLLPCSPWGRVAGLAGTNFSCCVHCFQEY